MDMLSTKKSSLAALALGAIGVVYGDIGTSPLYTIQVIFSEGTGVPLTPPNILGAISSIFWLLMFVVTFKYVLLVLRAHHKGEGGVMALLSLAVSSLRPQDKRSRGLLLLGVFGAALFYGDSVLTPAISVLSAVEGLQVAAPGLAAQVLPIAIGILIGLFWFQRHGTHAVGRFFGPIVIVWFVVLAAIGSWQIAQAPEILQALHPQYAWQFLQARGAGVFLAIGAILLAVTGAEALYADMGHFGRPAIQLAWLGLVFPCLAINYLGQGALLLLHPDAVSNPFYLSFPQPLLIPAVILATMATIIASQAVISGAFSMSRQAIQLGFLPRMRIVHTSASESGQIYMPAVNWALLGAVILVCLAFQSSAALASAYGIAVTGTMLITTILLLIVMRQRWQFPPLLAWSLTGLLATVDAVLLSSASMKFFQGGWFPVALSLVLIVLMTTWKKGRYTLLNGIASTDPKLQPFVSTLASSALTRVDRTAVYMVSNLETVPQALLHNLKHNQVLHQRNLFVNVVFDEVPYLNTQERVTLTPLAEGFWQVQLRYGFMQYADIPQALMQLNLNGKTLDPFTNSYFLSRDIIVPDVGGAMPRWRDQLFSVMSRNASSAVEYFNIPTNSVIELGSRVQI
ncbi:potassium transporter Kup [Methylophilus medardicus]|uniref:Probable potassium transport system protein Kup n=1 Tax=Methylophilus medardicus TaxID=2588534 RepID=A0A5B8CS80_9PROT|nr:potassium transporter Kup [Methylophilus medardicus]QDC43936.1 potassium transporter Kup [Methylophilus medardicus]QDC48943.1 potassium transporter Kup [Methylophilus medardicus]QDC52648.1 potassium transporter Kup [Methylophilus medardicus]